MDSLDASVRRALHGGRLEVALEFRRGEQGEKVALVELRDASGAVVASVEAESPEGLNLALARLVVLGFEAVAPAAAPPPRPRRRAEPGVLVAGVDGYRKGWVAVSLDPSGDVDVSTHAGFADVLSLRARVIAVDIPIDPAGLGSRGADAGARAFVGGGRASSVFPTPPRAALEARTFAEANEISRTVTGKGVSQQAFALAHKIRDVHELAHADERVIEVHPEVSFCELAGAHLPESKHTPEGLERRRALLEAAGIALPGAFPGVPESDLLDAAVAAWSAARYAEGTAQPLPAGQAERLGTIWR